MKSPSVSILIPVYNTTRRWLEECLASIESQTFNSHDVVIVNDGSTNHDTLECLGELSNKKHYRIIDRKDNRGIAYSLNEGLKICRNELVIRMDADDIMAKDRIEKQIEYMNRHPLVHLFGTRMICFAENEQGRKILLGLSPPHPETVTREIALNHECWFVNHPTVIYRKSEILGLGGYNESLRGLAEDYDLWIRMLKKNMVINNTQEPLHYFRIHANSLSSNLREDNNVFLYKTRESLK